MKKTKSPAPVESLEINPAESLENIQAGQEQEQSAKPEREQTKIAPAGNMLSGAAFAINAKLAAKADLVTKAKQTLAYAADLYSEGHVKGTLAAEQAHYGSLPLYDGAIGGLLSAAEVSAAIGDVFGYKPKKDGTPGKTPNGEGEAIRKRIVRAVSAYRHVTGQETTKFFEGVPPEKVAPLCEAIGNGSLSLYTAYERFGEIRKECIAKAEQAFNAKHIEALCESLAKPNAVSIIRGDAELQKAYGLMLALLTAIDAAPLESESES